MGARRFPVLAFSPAILLLAAGGLMILPLDWFACALAAAAVHEGCHVAALKLCSVRIYGVFVDIGGATIETEPLSPGKELLCAAAGPAGSLLLVLLARRAPLLALFGLVQGGFNLLPVYPHDGGRILHSALELTAPGLAERGTSAVSFGTVFVLSAGIFWFFLRLKLAAVGILIVGMLQLRLLARNKPCKADILRVQ